MNRCSYAYDTADYDGFAEKLAEEFPKKVIEYYFVKVFRFIEIGSTRSYYKKAVHELTSARRIYLDVLKDDERWADRLKQIRERYGKRRAFIDVGLTQI